MLMFVRMTECQSSYHGKTGNGEAEISSILVRNISSTLSQVHLSSSTSPLLLGFLLTSVSADMKLDPEQMKTLLERRGVMSRMSVVQYARQTQPQFEYDQQTLSASIFTVLQERVMLKERRVSDIPRSGIIDEESFSGEGKDFTMDAWCMGKPPLTKQEIMAYPPQRDRMVPYGDE
jgi:hypothetical protein